MQRRIDGCELELVGLIQGSESISSIFALSVAMNPVFLDGMMGNLMRAPRVVEVYTRHPSSISLK
jgi:hypothetical protein